MSDTDSFINEVSEEVRRDRMFALWKKYGPYVIGVIVAIVIAAGAKAYFDSEAQRAAESAGAALLEASEGDLAEQADALTALADTIDHDGARVVAELRAAGALAASEDAEGAAALYDRVAATSDVDPLLQDFAAFRATTLRGDTMEPGAYADALSPIANGSGPFRLLAMEARGLALVRAGDQTAGEDELRAAFSDEQAPEGMRRRIEALMTAIGGSLGGADDEAVLVEQN